jgi:hypothetical protein
MKAETTKRKPGRLVSNLCNLADSLKFLFKVKPEDDLIIVSGADSSHFKSLVQFIKSALYYEPWSQILIYDLGLTKTEADFISSEFPQIVMRVFDYGRYPPHFNIKIEAGRAAWKPVIIHNVLKEFYKSVVWLDAGCVITQPLYRVRNITRKNGFYAAFARGAIREWIHPQMVEYMKVEDDVLDRRILASTVVAFNHTSPKAMMLAEKWKQLALVEQCTAPPDANVNNTRYQTIMACLAYQLGLGDKISGRRMGFKNHQDID